MPEINGGFTGKFIISYHQILSHTIKYHHIPLHTITYGCIPLHTVAMEIYRDMDFPLPRSMTVGYCREWMKHPGFQPSHRGSEGAVKSMSKAATSQPERIEYHTIHRIGEFEIVKTWFCGLVWKLLGISGVYITGWWFQPLWKYSWIILSNIWKIKFMFQTTNQINYSNGCHAGWLQLAPTALEANEAKNGHQSPRLPNHIRKGATDYCRLPSVTKSVRIPKWSSDPSAS